MSAKCPPKTRGSAPAFALLRFVPPYPASWTDHFKVWVERLPIRWWLMRTHLIHPFPPNPAFRPPLTTALFAGLSALAALGCSTLGPGAPPAPDGEVPLAPIPTSPDPSGSGPALGRWTITQFEGDLTVTVTAVGPLCSDAVAAHTPAIDSSYIELDDGGVMSFVMKWDSSTDEGLTYDYTDRAGAQSTWTWPDGVDGSTPQASLVLYGQFFAVDDLRGGWEISSQNTFGDCRQENSGVGTWEARGP